MLLAEVAAAVLRISRHMGLNTEGVQLTSWKKTAVWLQAQSVIADLFGSLQIEFSLERMDARNLMDVGELAAATLEELQGWATHFMVGEELGETEFSRLMQLAQANGWQPGAAPPSREELHARAFPLGRARIREHLCASRGRDRCRRRA